MHDFNEDIYIGVKQASQYVIGSRYIDVGTTYQYVDLDNQENELLFEKSRLVKTPGYETLITDVQDGYFEITQDHIYVNIQRDDKDYRFVLTYAKEYIEEVVDEEGNQEDVE